MARVVIVGGGIGGVTTAKALKKTNLEVTLITPTEYVEWSPGRVRSLTVPQEKERSLAPSVVQCVQGAKVVQGKAVSVTSDTVMVATSGQSDPVAVPYDLLVIGTGGRYAHPSTSFLKSPEVRRSLTALRRLCSTPTCLALCACRTRRDSRIASLRCRARAPR